MTAGDDFQIVWSLPEIEHRISNKVSGLQIGALAWGLGLEPRFSDSKSDVLPIRRPPKAKRPSESMPTGARIQKADHAMPSTMWRRAT
jgi:hypothetical protein